MLPLKFRKMCLDGHMIHRFRCQTPTLLGNYSCSDQLSPNLACLLTHIPSKSLLNYTAKVRKHLRAFLQQ
jgi:hypothetical protein